MTIFELGFNEIEDTSHHLTYVVMKIRLGLGQCSWRHVKDPLKVVSALLHSFIIMMFHGCYEC